MPTDQEEKTGRLKILIVDDNESIRVVLAGMLEIFSSEILFAKDGNEAVSVIEDNADIDLIFMDVYMNNMDGFEATKSIRQINKKVIIFVMTATPISELIEDFSGTLINDYFPKPFNRDYLGQLIAKHFKKGQLTKV